MALTVLAALCIFFAIIGLLHATDSEETLGDLIRQRRQNLFINENREKSIEHDILNQDSIQQYWKKVRKSIGSEFLKRFNPEVADRISRIYGDGNLEQVRRRRTSQLGNNQQHRRSISEASRREKLNSQSRQNRLNQPSKHHSCNEDNMS